MRSFGHDKQDTNQFPTVRAKIDVGAHRFCF